MPNPNHTHTFKNCYTPDCIPLADTILESRSGSVAQQIIIPYVRLLALPAVCHVVRAPRSSISAVRYVRTNILMKCLSHPIVIGPSEGCDYDSKGNWEDSRKLLSRTVARLVARLFFSGRFISSVPPAQEGRNKSDRMLLPFRESPPEGPRGFRIARIAVMAPINPSLLITANFAWDKACSSPFSELSNNGIILFESRLL